MQLRTLQVRLLAQAFQLLKVSIQLIFHLLLWCEQLASCALSPSRDHAVAKLSINMHAYRWHALRDWRISCHDHRCIHLL